MYKKGDLVIYLHKVGRSIHSSEVHPVLAKVMQDVKSPDGLIPIYYAAQEFNSDGTQRYFHEYEFNVAPMLLMPLDGYYKRTLPSGFVRGHGGAAVRKHAKNLTSGLDREKLWPLDPEKEH